MITPEQLLLYYTKLQDPSVPELPGLIASADALMASYCGLPKNAAGRKTLEASSHTLYPLPAFGEPRALALKLHPIPVTVTTVHVDEEWEYGSDALVADTEYLYADDDGLLRLKPSATSAWSASPRANRVVATVGFDLRSNNEHELLPITAAMVQSLIDRPHLQQTLSASIAGQTITTTDLESLLPAAVRAALNASYTIWSRRVG